MLFFHYLNNKTKYLNSYRDTLYFQKQYDDRTSINTLLRFLFSTRNYDIILP